MQQKVHLFTPEDFKILDKIFSQQLQLDQISTGTPVPMMLSKPLLSLEDAADQFLKFKKGESVCVEPKYDGERLQVLSSDPLQQKQKRAQDVQQIA